MDPHRSPLALAALALVAGACAPLPPAAEPAPPPPPSHAFGTAQLDLAGTIALTDTGELALALRTACQAASWDPSPCGGDQLRTIPVVAALPSGQRVRGVWLDASHVVFAVPWDALGIDPLADDAIALASRPWSVGTEVWTPAADDVQRMLGFVAAATDTEINVVRGGPPPDLVVTLQAADGALTAGQTGELIVHVDNRGRGAAYRVTATTRSSVAALHGRHLSFGLVPAGGSKVRRLSVTIPGDETAPDAMIVLAVAEANGFAPADVGTRVAIHTPTDAPSLAIACEIPGRDPRHLELDAGERVDVRCTARNDGDVDARVGLETQVADGRPIAAPEAPVAAHGSAVFDVAVAIPRELALDDRVVIAIRARDRRFPPIATATIEGTIRVPKLCARGHLTRAQYRDKIAELRTALVAGDISQDEFDRYDAELVGCLE